LAVGGWHDGYRNTMGHLVENLSAPCKAIAGPWNHKYPHIGEPGPQIDFLGEMLRWWDHWLKGIDRGVQDDPAYRAYVMDSVRPEVSFSHRPGRWVGVAGPNGQGTRVLAFSGTALADQAGPVGRSVATDVSCGQGTGEYFPFGFGPGELPDDQSADDAKSLCFDSDVLNGPLDILGRARVRVLVASDEPAAQVAVRLNDLRPDGSSALIAHGFLNLRQRLGADRMDDLPVGQVVEAEVVLDQAAYHLPAGHRLRVAISPSYFPFVWPEAKPVVLTVEGGELVLPVLSDEGSDVEFAAAKGAPPIAYERLTPRVEEKLLHKDGAVWQQVISGQDGVVRDP
ncbi:MAG: CocE/NonD family hydrolase, partial [Paracoccaceae bacterium]